MRTSDLSSNHVGHVCEGVLNSFKGQVKAYLNVYSVDDKDEETHFFSEI
jgi:hypothetical protein